MVFYHQSKVAKKEQIIKKVTAERDNALATLQTMEKQRQKIAAIDSKHTRELADAKSENNRLRANVADGIKRLQLNTSCKTLPKTATASCLDDATSPRLNDSALEDYFRLREHIAIASSQITGLQDYIIQVCMTN